MHIADGEKIFKTIDVETESYWGHVVHASSSYLAGINDNPSKKARKQAADYFTKKVGVTIPIGVSNAILDLYPRAKQALAIDDCVEGETAAQLSFAICHLLTGCDWPRNEPAGFNDLLKHQATRLLEMLEMKSGDYVLREKNLSDEDYQVRGVDEEFKRLKIKIRRMPRVIISYLIGKIVKSKK